MFSEVNQFNIQTIRTGIEHPYGHEARVATLPSAGLPFAFLGTLVYQASA